MKRLLLVGLALAVLWVGSAAASSLWALPGDFVDEQGRMRRLAEFAQPDGPATVVAMEYTECRFVCSIAWRRLTDVQAEADRRGMPVRFVILSLDPAHDTPALWREYRQMRGLKRDNWVFLTGSRAATDAAVQRLGVRWWLYNGAIMHDFRIMRLDAQGRVAKVLDNYDDPVASLLAP
jgi:cytochrome oxidase Cu insertion factor (SCO1/SenC/PrrC family)